MNEGVQEFNHLPLKAHQLLVGVPMHSFDVIELDGGSARMKMDEIYRITGLNQAQDFKFGFITKTLFDIRGWIGKISGWDNVPELVSNHSWITRLTAAEREKSIIPSGTVESINTILYCYENEILFEIINRTVHCFWVLASEQRKGGYVLYVAIYVKKLNWRTPIYMSLVSPVLKWIIYPAVKKSIKRNWSERFAGAAVSPKLELKI